jgi:hypothetical protein
VTKWLLLLGLSNPHLEDAVLLGGEIWWSWSMPWGRPTAHAIVP